MAEKTLLEHVDIEIEVGKTGYSTMTEYLHKKAVELKVPFTSLSAENIVESAGRISFDLYQIPFTPIP